MGLKWLHHIKYLNKKNISIKENVEIGDNILFDATAGTIKIDGPSYLIGNTKFHAAGGELKIGKNVTIGDYSFINAAGNVTIGDNVLFADKVNVIASEHGYTDVNQPIRNQPSTSKAIIIGEGSWIGINVSILAGASIGKNSVVGANSVVKGQFEDYCVIVGNPARVIKRFENDKWVGEKRNDR